MTPPAVFAYAKKYNALILDGSAPDLWRGLYKILDNYYTLRFQIQFLTDQLYTFN